MRITKRAAPLMVAAFALSSTVALAAPVTVEITGANGARAYLFQGGKPTPVAQYPQGTRMKAGGEPKGPWRTILLPSPVGGARTAWMLNRDLKVLDGEEAASAAQNSSTATPQHEAERTSATGSASWHISAFAGMELLTPAQLEASIGLSQVPNFTLLPYLEVWRGGASSRWGFGLRGGYFTVSGRATDTAGAVYAYSASGIPIMLTVDFKIAQGRNVDFSVGTGAGMLIGAKASATDSVQTFETGSFLAPMVPARLQVVLRPGKGTFFSLIAEGSYQLVLPLGSPKVDTYTLKNDLSGIVGLLGARFRL